MVYHYRMDNDDGWKVTFEIHAKYSTDPPNPDQNHIIGRSYRNVANGSPREGDIPLRCP